MLYFFLSLKQLQYLRRIQMSKIRDISKGLFSQKMMLQLCLKLTLSKIIVYQLMILACFILPSVQGPQKCGVQFCIFDGISYSCTVRTCCLQHPMPLYHFMPISIFSSTENISNSLQVLDLWTLGRVIDNRNSPKTSLLIGLTADIEHVQRDL